MKSINEKGNKNNTAEKEISSNDVTSHKLAERKNEESENQLQRIFRESPFTVALMEGENFIFRLVNAKAAEVIGKTEAEIVGKPVFELMPELEKDGFREILSGVLKTGKPFVGNELPATYKKNGQLITAYFDFVYEPYYDASGMITGIISSGIDVTEKVLARKKIEESEEQLRLITDALPVLISYIDKNRCYRFNNKAYENWFGHSSEEIYGKHMMDVLGEVAYKKLKPKIDDVLMGNPVHFEMSVPYKDGGVKWVVADYIPHFGKDNEVLGYYGVVNDVSTLMKAEALNFQLAAIVQSSEDAIISKTLEGIVTSWNRSAEKMYGYTETEMVGQHISKIIPEQRLEEEPQIIENILQGKIVTHFETQRLTKEGKLLDISLTISPIKNTEGKIIGASKIARNITEQVKARKKIEESEKQFNALANNIQNLAWMANADGWIYWYNNRWYEYTGTTAEQMEGWGWQSVHDAEHLPAVLEKWKSSIDTGHPFEMVFPLRGADGVFRPFLTRVMPVKNDEGAVIRWVGTNTNIEKQKMQALELENAVKERTKELKEKNQSLAESENRIQTIFEAAPDAVITIDHHGIISNWNEEAEKIFGWQKNEVIGKTLSEIIIPPRYREQHKNGLKNFLRTGQGKVIGKPIEIEALKKDNTEIPVELKISASSVNHSPPVFIGFVRDISQRRQAESALNNKNIELIEVNANLEKINKELESFTYVSSHDLQEPLRKIQTFAGRILETENQNLTDKGKDYFHRMQEASQRMQTLIQDLLAFSKINSGESKFETSDLSKIVEEVKTDFKEILEEKHATIVTNELCEHAPIIPFQFRQLMHNLIGNALKFSKPQTPPHIIIKSSKIKYAKPTIENLLPQKEYCHITIQDNGIGFEKHFSEKIFEVFQRLHDKEKYSGTGIGLAIVKKIVDNHNGIITATSELGKGATFDIYIPA